ncbi:hypothetical protein PC118_g14396 [Phytophthora cactorum]|uniref:Uncharacterized protein n=1 Tax=Phytophthora cactorum TaxID=29920 RepID=A0A8T1FLZ4_9STRA|nr:hypothetical protein PC118_g14396 [Phytophthora cactorum]
MLHTLDEMDAGNNKPYKVGMLKGIECLTSLSRQITVLRFEVFELGGGPASANTTRPCFAGSPRRFALATRSRHRRISVPVFLLLLRCSTSRSINKAHFNWNLKSKETGTE